MNGRRVLVTGGSGFIGTNLVEHFVNAGAEVRNFDIAPPRDERYAPCWVRVDLLDRAELRRRMVDFGPTAVLHFAARTDLDERAGLAGYAANVEGLANLIEGVRATPEVERLVVASSQLVGPPGESVADEHEYRPTTTYGLSKVLGERLLRAAHDVGATWTIVRPTSIWGPWCGAPFREFFGALDRGRYVHPAGLRVAKQWGYVGNACFQVARLLEAPEHVVHRRTFYVADYEPVDLRDFADRVRRAFGRPPVRSVPAAALSVTARLGDAARRAGWRNPPLTSFRYRNLVRPEAIDMGPLAELTGPLPWSVDDGIARTVAWWRA